jgi:chromosome segregation ATPase
LANGFTVKNELVHGRAAHHAKPAPMIEEVMIFALGFLTAGLIALAVAPAFWRRALRLSTRKLEMQLPLSQAEILAERDLLRAEAAVEVRRLEQKVQALNGLRSADMAELGRRAAAIARQKAELHALTEQNSELSQELAALQRGFAEASAELAAIEKDSYDTSGLIARKDAEIRELKGGLEEMQALAAKRRDTIEVFEADMASLKKALAAEIAKVEHLEGELATFRLRHQADQVTLKAAAARVADREEALEASVKREKELIRLRKLQTEAARAAEDGYLEKIERLRGAQADSQEALEASRKTCDRLTKELEDLRAALPPEDATAMLMQREENEILREKIKEIGAAVIRSAGGPCEDESGERAGKGTRSEDQVPEKATA